MSALTRERPGAATTSLLRTGDGLGSTMAVVNAGAVQDSYTYDIYGTPTKTGSLANEFDFAGQQTDGTGLQYLRARYMDPATGTFLSRDPLADDPRWANNPHGYADASPARFVDPSGLKECDTEGCQSGRPAPRTDYGPVEISAEDLRQRAWVVLIAT